MMKVVKPSLHFSVILSVGLPFLPILLWAVSKRWFYPAPLPQEFSLRAFNYLFQTSGGPVVSGLVSSTGIALATTAISLFLGLPAGRALGLYTFRGKTLVALLLTLPVIVPPLSVAMGLHLWFIRLNLAETFIGIVLVHLIFCLPYATFVMWGVFTDYDPDIEQQARTLGCTRTGIVFRVMLPLIMPGLTGAALFSFLLSWSQYLSTLIIGGGKMLTLPILLFALMESGDRPVAAAVSLIFILPAFLALMASAHTLGRTGIKGVR